MPRLFESITPDLPQPKSADPVAADLNTLASRAQRRQQQALQQSAADRVNRPFPAQSLSEALPGLQQRNQGIPQVQGIPGVQNLVPRLPDNKTDVPDTADLELPPVVTPGKLESTPAETPYVDLTPGQRNQALRRLGLKPKTFAAQGDGTPWRTESGASVLAFDTGIASGPEVYLAEDSAAAHSILFKTVKDLGIRATPRPRRLNPGEPTEGVVGYEVEWQVNPNDLERFNEIVDYLDPSSRNSMSNGATTISFDGNHPVNRFFMQAPFGGR